VDSDEINDNMNVVRAVEQAVVGRTHRGSKRGMMQGGAGGAGHCVDEGDGRDANDEVAIIVIARNIIIIIAWLSGTQWSQGDGEGADALPSSWIALTMSETLQMRTPAEN
jgi:hypothetical protein